MANYHVTNKKGQQDWNVKKEGSSKASAIVETQNEAEKIAKQLSANSGGGEVVIHKPNGGPIRDKDTVAPGNDPSNVKDKKH
jgi:hypothetical protein